MRNTLNENETITTSVERSMVSGLPIPPSLSENRTVPVPLGTDCGLTILDWAGFTGAASYTFDDSRPTQIEHWRELGTTGINMTFYVVPVWNTPETRTILRTIHAAGSELGNHTYSHKRIATLAGNKDEMTREITECASYISETLGLKAACSFAYPYGELDWRNSFNGRFMLARSVEQGTIKPLDDTDPFALPIFAVNERHTEKTFNEVLDTSVKEGSWVIFMFHALLPGDNWAAGVPIDSVMASLGHAKATKKLWLDSVENIGAYWIAQKILSAVTPISDERRKIWTWNLPERFPTGMYLRVRINGGSLHQNGKRIPWNSCGFYEIALDERKLEWGT